jgi:hypothetical protein
VNAGLDLLAVLRLGLPARPSNHPKHAIIGIPSPLRITDMG